MCAPLFVWYDHIAAGRCACRDAYIAPPEHSNGTHVVG